MSLLPMRPLGFGEIIDGALQLYRHNFGLFYLIALAAAFPGYVYMQLVGDLVAVASEPADDPLLALGQMGREVGGTLAVRAVPGMFSLLGWLAMAVAMFKRIEERRTTLGYAYRRALRHMPSALGATILAILALLVVVIVAVMIVVPVVVFLVARGDTAGVATSIGLGIVTVVAVIAIWLGGTFAIIPSVVAEQQGAFGRWRVPYVCAEARGCASRAS